MNARYTINRIASVFALITLVALVLGVTRSAIAGPLVHWSLDDGAGTTATDTVGTQNGTLENMEVGDWVTGTIGTGALDFGGVDERVTSNTAGGLPAALGNVGSGDFMISAWIKGSSSGNMVAIGGDFGSGAASNHGLALATTGLSVRNGAATTPGTVTAAFGSSVTTGSWIHVAGVRDAANDELRVYRNGSLSGSTAYDGTISVSGNTLGGSNRQLTLGLALKPSDQSIKFPLIGMLDDVGVYEEIRTSGEIRALYTLGLSAGQDGSSFDFNYDLSQSQMLFDVHEAGSGTVTVEDTIWNFTNSIDATGQADGDLFTLGGDTFLVLSGGGSTGATGLIVAEIPEPSSFLLLGLGVLGLLRHARRRRNR